MMLKDYYKIMLWIIFIECFYYCCINTSIGNFIFSIR